MEKNLKCKLLKILLIFFIMIYLVSQHADGAAAAAGTNLLTKIQDECDVLGTTAKDYHNPSIEISDPRLEAALIMEILKERLMKLQICFLKYIMENFHVLRSNTANIEGGQIDPPPGPIEVSLHVGPGRVNK